MTEVLYEISRLSARDCFLVVERHKSAFTYPIHRHREFELNLVQNARGVRRIVGDSIEEIGDFDLTLIAGENLEHVWEQGNCTSPNIREVTIQFLPELIGSELMERNQFSNIKKMFEKARHGIAFPMESIMKVYGTLDAMIREKDGFIQMLDIFKILYELSCGEYRTLASSSFSNAGYDTESRRIKNAKQYISDHYADNLSLDLLASLVGMSPAAFSRFFKQHTGRTLISYISEIRLGEAARALVDSSRNISEICYSCGFNNLSNFNRTFKAVKGISPKEFRSIYHKKKIIV